MCYITPPRITWPYIGDPFPSHPSPLVPGIPPAIPYIPPITPTRPNITITTTNPPPFRTKREERMEELLRMAIEELLTGDDDAWALAELIEEEIGK